ncbi:dipeptidyl aminopeptidase/acylaminoacyl peptidase [Isoptericola variabilis 225] [Mycolicibacterium parafortuitum]|uniref:Dipeptidyl aminopeptidase/acylaminoacyl peptidase [Isoptericola variabilis 225] n=2 Tax=Mycolicibacterium parafortuitum TaxID=39692 RepID=A0A375YPD2_MYCPF|nr:dipeptidyl aminopeptidase/acylaminoacyl peptidase [Isoptericola variabilis 225] [Mycolicibacterium parafortuitum]
MKSYGVLCYEEGMAAHSDANPVSSTPFHNLDEFLSLPRVSGLAVSPDGSRVVTTVAALDDKRTEFVSALWELDPAGRLPARRITHGRTGESAPAFTADGDLLFLASRPDAGEDKPPKALWCLPAPGGEAYQVCTMPGGVDGVVSAGGATVLASSMLPSATDLDADEKLRAARKDNKVSAILHTGYPVRSWDHDIGPAQTHLFHADGDTRRDLTPDPAGALRDSHFDISRDGTFVVTSWNVAAPGAALRSVLVRIDMATAERAVIADDPGADLGFPAIAPDGQSVAYLRETLSTPHQAPRITLGLLRFGEEPCELTGGWDRWPTSVTWSHDGSTLIVTADENGRGPIFAVDPQTGAVNAVVADDHTYSDVRTAPGGVLFALRGSYSTPQHPVRIDPDGSVTVLDCVALPELPGSLTEITATAEDGMPVRSWLVLPDGEAPAPLVLWIHGGPLGSWNTWHWRWNPWLMAAQGYAVLLPDPALSTGYGQDFIQRGWGAWGFAPYTDLMAATDAACAHPRVDDTRTAAMGGSFGGYMANWIAGHTDRFAAIVTHASLWALDQFGGTTDGSYWWAREMTPEMTSANSPHLFVDQIRTPMLVIHGDKDYRVPIGEALRLWYDLLSRSALPAADSGPETGSTVHRFLYFPSENHWVLSPQHAKLWYEVVLAFLGGHVLGEDSGVPELLG